MRSPGERIFYKMTRLSPLLRNSTWEDTSDVLRAAYEDIAKARPDLVPSDDEIRARDAETEAKDRAERP